MLRLQGPLRGQERRQEHRFRIRCTKCNYFVCNTCYPHKRFPGAMYFGHSALATYTCEEFGREDWWVLTAEDGNEEVQHEE